MGHRGACVQNTFLVSMLSQEGASGNRKCQKPMLRAFCSMTVSYKLTLPGHRFTRGFE